MSGQVGLVRKALNFITVTHSVWQVSKVGIELLGKLKTNSNDILICFLLLCFLIYSIFSFTGEERLSVFSYKL